VGVPAEAIEQAKNADLIMVAERYGVRLRRAGVNEFVGPCPTCGGRDRFSINIKKRLFNCRQCGAGGGAIALVQRVEKCGFADAVLKLAEGARP